jgi:hypothetical protein
MAGSTSSDGTVVKHLTIGRLVIFCDTSHTASMSFGSHPAEATILDYIFPKAYLWSSYIMLSIPRARSFLTARSQPQQCSSLSWSTACKLRVTGSLSSTCLRLFRYKPIIILPMGQINNRQKFLVFRLFRSTIVLMKCTLCIKTIGHQVLWTQNR